MGLDTRGPVFLDGRLYWLLPAIAGGSGGPGAGDDGGDGGQDDGQGGTSGAPAGTAGAPGTGGEPDDDAGAAGDQWPDEAKRLIRKLRKQEQDAERRARDAQKALEERSQAGMSEAERNAQRARQLEQELATARTQIRQQSMRDAFRAAGESAKAKDPASIWRLIDQDSVDFGPDGEVLNASQLVRELRRTMRWAFEGAEGPGGSADAAQGAQQRPATGSDSDRSKQMNEWVRGATGRR